MAVGIRALRMVQIGQEVSAGGTTDPASTIWRGEGMLKDNRVTTFPTENIGIIGGVNRTYVGKTGGEIELTGIATYEQLPYIFNAGFYLSAPTTDAGSESIRTWNVQSASTDPISSSDLQTLVIEGGDNAQAEIMRYGFVRQFSLSGTVGEAVNLSATVEGREVGLTTFTAGLSIPTVKDLLMSKAKVYIDPSTDAAGTTQKSNTLLGFQLDVVTGWKGQDTADGRLDFSFAKRISDEITLQLTFEHETTSIAQKAAWRAETEQVIRLRFDGPALATTDTSYDTKTLIIDLYGKWETFDVIDEQDGNDIVTGTFKVGYSTAASKKATFIVVNELATLP